ncbi:MAG: NFACT family protein, partial [Parasporobacterium sp.]|nr:NFACT family protein [Parasporobacterium sp.]
MAFDGSIVHAIVRELSETVTDGRIVKIAQPEKDELILTIKKEGTQRRLLLSVSPSLPVVYLAEVSKPAPMQAPAFCMLLRKHLTGGRILSVTQPSMERIIEFEIEHFNEMGDICRKILTVELMGKYSNIILRDGSRIIDSIRHVSALISSVREVLPGREYFIPFSEDKVNPFRIAADPNGPDEFRKTVFSQGAASGASALYTNVTGFSPILSEEVFYRADLDSERPASSFSADEQQAIYRSFAEVISLIDGPHTRPNIIYKNNEPDMFAAFRFRLFEDGRYTVKDYDSISELLFDFYSRKQTVNSLRQKTSDLRQMISSVLNKDYKKYDLQQRQIRDTEKKDKFRVYGELLTAYGYSVEPGAAKFDTVDFYTGKEVSIPLDPSLTAIENGKNYFKKYSKLKRTADALSEIILQTSEEIAYLESVMVALDMVRDHNDISDLRKELRDTGFIKKNNDRNGKASKDPRSGRSSPLHYISSDGFHMYVGKNNYQNEYLSFRLATGNDWWFHAKDIPGSHVIVKSEGQELPDRTFEEAAALAARYSSSKGSGKVEVQYTQKKNLKKPPAAKPGFVVFNTYFSI